MSFSQRMDIAEEAAYLTSQRAQEARARAEAQAADLRARAEEAQVRLTETLAACHTIDTGVTDKAQGDVASGRTSGEKLNRCVWNAKEMQIKEHCFYSFFKNFVESSLSVDFN